MDGGNEDEFYLMPPGVTKEEKMENFKKRYDHEVKQSEKKADELIDRIINKVDGKLFAWSKNIKTSEWKEKAKNKFKKKDQTGVSNEARTGSLIGSIAEEVSLQVDPALSEEELAKLDKYIRLEKSFPFYRMPYSLLNDRLHMLILKENNKLKKDQVWTFKQVSIDGFKSSFGELEEFKDLQDENSNLTKFLSEYLVSGSVEPGQYSVIHFRVLLLLWCKATRKQKAEELYQIVNQSSKEISCENERF